MRTTHLIACPRPLSVPVGSRAFIASGIAALLSTSIAGCGVVDSESEPDLDQREEAISANPGSTVAKSTELNWTTGRYPEVMLVKIVSSTSYAACTGTVIAPYAVLTANHCMNPSATVYADWWGDVTLQASGYHLNPYLNSAYTPAWWTTLNNAQKAAGGRQDDWPAQHDQAILFVPGLTPQFLRDRGITPAAIQPSATASRFTVVGVGSTGGWNRDSMATSFLPSTANTITTWDRDGYLTRDIQTANLGNVDPGDSGGPSLGSSSYPWLSGASIETGRYVVGTTQNNGASGVSPLAYDPGVTMTANQRLTVRLNALWVQARMDDPDGDGLPSACDRNPTSSNPATDNLCPASIGGPSGSAIGGAPVAQLTCKPGYVAVGLRGRSGDLIDRLSIQCRAFSCFGNADATCAGNASYEYWSDEFGGDGGGAFTRSCPSGYMMVGVDATDNPTNGYVHSLAPRCAPYSGTNVPSVGSATYQGTWAGNPSWGAPARRDCASGTVLVGFQARSHTTSFVTGLQPICSSDPIDFKWFMGGQGGGDTVLRCPVGTRAIGTLQNARDGAINAFGLLCGPSNLPGNATPNSQIVVARGGYMHYDAWLQVPPAVEPLATAHLPNGIVASRCDDYLVGIKTHVNGLVWSIDAIYCSEGGGPTTYTTRTVGVGTPSNGYYRAQSCLFYRPVDALYVRSGWLTDGISLHCD